MPLTNCRPLQNRSLLEDVRSLIHPQLPRHLGLRGGNGNLAMMIVEGRVNRPITQPHDLEAVIAPRPGGHRWVIAARNRPHEEHFEILCINAYIYRFRRQPTHVTYVFTEREPCHGDARFSCMARLETFLATYGRYGRRTPVRYREAYFNTPEAADGRLLGRR